MGLGTAKNTTALGSQANFLPQSRPAEICGYVFNQKPAEVEKNDNPCGNHCTKGTPPNSTKIKQKIFQPVALNFCGLANKAPETIHATESSSSSKKKSIGLHYTAAACMRLHCPFVFLQQPLFYWVVWQARCIVNARRAARKRTHCASLFVFCC